jgi:rfaE bifunctional protein nucleotidyltransferase chain/domain
LQSLVSLWKSEGKKVVFTNGVFDILHIGHADYLQKAQSLGDKLVVAVNDDASVRRLNKGPERPINPEVARALLVAALRCVDAVILFSDDTPLALIKNISPDVLVKGGDYDADEREASKKTYIVGSKEVKELGGSVQVIPLVEGFSSTSIIQKIKK